MLLTAGAVASCGLPQTRKSLRSSEKIVPLKQTAISENPKADQVIDGGAINVRVLGGAAVKDQIASGSISKNLESLNATAAVTMAAGTPGASGSKTADNQLYIQIPISALGSKYFFGGVITTVSDRKNSDLGRLKLTDLPAFSVHTILALSNGKKLLGLMGCTGKCSATSKEQPLIGLPIIGISRDKKAVVVDVSKFGESLDMMGVLDPQGKNTGLKTIATRTTAVDMSDGTIVWDVEHKMIAKDKKPEDKSAETLIGVRYYLKLDSGMSASFVTRKPVAGVGFFTTKLREETLITRFAQSELDTKPIHYFVKNVPAEYQDAFAASFENWNKTFSEETGKEMISYEFVPAGDPKNDLLVPGDVRFNIVEWDLVNTAPYGGLGPSIASQETGETFAANVLVQGPTIEKMYNEWFKVASQAQNLAADGKAEAADLVIRDARRKIAAGMADSKLQTVASLSLGSALKFHVQSQDEHLDDPIALRQDFFDTPAGQTYDEYMNGYFKDMITHELGHNMGLRHNFKGNLYASADN